MKEKKTYKQRTRMSAKQILALAEGKTFAIEKNPPPPMRSDQIYMAKVLEKVDRTITNLDIGQAFIMPASTKNSVGRHLKNAYPKNRFTFAIIPDNAEAIRIYRKG